MGAPSRGAAALGGAMTCPLPRMMRGSGAAESVVGLAAAGVAWGADGRSETGVGATGAEGAAAGAALSPPAAGAAGAEAPAWGFWAWTSWQAAKMVTAMAEREGFQSSVGAADVSSELIAAAEVGDNR